MKRKKMREMIFGVKPPLMGGQLSMYKHQKEDIQNHYRNLKITNNITRDENIRLKTRLQHLQAELNQRDKELEKLTLRLQQNLSGEIKPVSGNYTESYLVSQLKRNSRDLKLEVQEKDKLIE
jgi:predicted transcriptional regulator